MKSLSTGFSLRVASSATFISAILVSSASVSRAAGLKQARVTQIIQEVKILPGQAEARPAALNDEVRDGTAVRTGEASRSELTFSDLTIARLGANTIFSFDEGSRTIDLAGGAVLLKVPKNSGGAKISTAAVTAAITGTTVMAEYNCIDRAVKDPRAQCPDALFKFIVLEGTMQVCRPGNPRQCVEVRAGQMLIGKASEELDEPVDVDLSRLLATSLLIQGFPPLGSEGLMSDSARVQLDQKANGTLTDLGDIRFNDPTPVSFRDPTSLDPRDQRRQASPSPSPSPSPDQSPSPSPSPSPSVSPSPTASPSPSVSPIPSPSPSPSASPTPAPTPSPSVSPTPQPTPQKYGTPPVITSSVPYTITTGTTLQTDPLITTNGVTDEGRIYRSPADDGAFSAWAFTATSEFDNASGIDTHFGNPLNLQVAAFKFASLILAGDPTVSTANGGATKLALISVGDMRSGSTLDVVDPGIILRFTGIDTVLLATQAGSILLNGLRFEGIEQLYFYARGTNSDVVLGSSIFGTDLAILQAERNVQVNGTAQVGSFFVYAGNDFLSGSGNVTASEINIRAGHDINFSLLQFAVGDSFGQTIDLLAGNAVNIDIASNQSAFARAGSINVTGFTINVFSSSTGDDTITFESNATVLFNAGAGGFLAENVAFDHFAATNPFDITSEGEILVLGIIGVDNMTAGTSFRSQFDVITQTLQAGTTIDVTSGSLFAFNFVTAGSTINVSSQLSSSSVTAGGDVTADLVTVRELNAPTGVLRVGSGGIRAFVTSEGASLQHTFTIDSIVSPSGIDFSGNQFNGANNDFSGGRLTIFANSLRFDAEVGIGSVNFDGADGFGFDFSPASGRGGNGGIFIANAINSIFVGENISATTGLNDPNNADAAFGGAGGQVTLDSSAGAVTVNSTIQVSSNDPDPGQTPPPALHRSASGGSITLHSGLTSGTAITLNNTSHLLSLLDDAAPGPGGTIRVLSEGGDIFADGEIVADHGTIIISNLGSGGGERPNGAVVPLISLDGSFASLRAETVDISSAGDVHFGVETLIPINAVTVGISARNNISGMGVYSFQGKGGPTDVRDSSGNFSIIAENAISLGNIYAARRNLGRTTGLNLTVSAGSTLTLSGGLVLETDASGLDSGGNVQITAGGTMNLGEFAFLNTKVTDNDVTDGANVSLDAGTLSTSHIDARVGANNGSILNGGNITLTVAGDATVTQATSGNSSGLNLRIELTNSGSIGTGGNILATVGGNLTTDFINAQINGLGAITSGGNITFNIAGMLTVQNGDANFILALPSFSDGPSAIDGGIFAGAINVSAASISLGSSSFPVSLNAYVNNSSSGTPTGVSGSVLVNSLGAITVSDRLNVLGTVNAGGAINAFAVASTNVISTTVISAGFGGITRFMLPQFGVPIDILHTLTAPTITSAGGINFNGLNADGDFTTATRGGQLTMNTDSIAFGATLDVTGGGMINGPVTLNGGDGSSAGGFDAADGGILTVNTTGAIDVGSAIEATSGRVQNGQQPSGKGGAVTLNSTGGTVTVSGRIEVSSRDPASSGSPTPSPRRRSVQGGNITIQSGRAGNAPSASPTPRTVAVNITSSSQLLALLDAAPSPAPGGKITILATGAHSDVNVNGRLEATNGTIDIRHEADGGRVNIGTAGSSPAPTTLSADVIRARALGANGQLNVGNSNLAADSLMRLYAPGSNGQLNFIANVTLSSGRAIDLAAGTVTIQPNVIVNIAGNGGPARVFTNNANYSGFGGSNPSNGTFGGNGANTPQPLTAAPPFDAAPPAPSTGGH